MELLLSPNPWKLASGRREESIGAVDGLVFHSVVYRSKIFDSSTGNMGYTQSGFMLFFLGLYQPERADHKLQYQYRL